MGQSDDLIRSSASDLVAMLRIDAITPHDCLDALQARIEQVEPHVNALPTLCFERARKHADTILAKPPAERGLLCGLPVAIKDLTDVAGVRTTYGSPIFADWVPEKSDILVEHLEAEGGIVYAKSNTPEFGAGAHTFNEVFGTTLNPYDPTKSAAGASGGSAAALATGTAWLAHGSDMGGSLRNPASFCGIVGMRPSPGRVAASRRWVLDDTLSVQGPMARSVEDLALLLDAMTGDSPRDPLSKPRPLVSYVSATASGWKPLRVAYSRDLGITPVDPEVAEITRAAAQRFTEVGVEVVEAHPDFSGAHEAFDVLRAQSFVNSMGPLLESHRDKLKPEVVWNIEQGLALKAADIAKAEHRRAAILSRTATFFESHDLLLCPATIVPPFPKEERYVKECAGVTFANYYQWLAVAYAITLAGAPALSLPCGFTKAGLPVGLQVVAAPNADAAVLAGARLLEQILGLYMGQPITPTAG